MFLSSHIPAYGTCFAGKVCSPVRFTWGTSLGEDKLGARVRILNTKVAHRANVPPLAGCVAVVRLIVAFPTPTVHPVYGLPPVPLMPLALLRMLRLSAGNALNLAALPRPTSVPATTKGTAACPTPHQTAA